MRRRSAEVPPTSAARGATFRGRAALETRGFDEAAERGRHEERRRLGHELHDGTGQLLSLALLRLGLLGDQVGEQQKRSLGELRSFTGKSDEEVLRKALSAPMPEARGEGVPPDLAAVAAKALSRERSERYADAKEMEADVSAWSEGRLVSVYRYSVFQRVQRLANRHRLATLSLVVTLLVAGAFLGGLWGRRVEAQHQRADELLLRAFRYSGSAQWDRASTYFAGARVARDLPQARWGLATVGATGVVPLYKVKRPAWQVRSVAFAPDGKSFAVAGDDRALRIFETSTGLERLRVDVSEPVRAMAYTPDGGSLVCALGSSIDVYSPSRGAREGRLELDGPARSLAISLDGARLAASTGNEIRLWDLASRRELGRTRASAPVETVAFLPSGELIFGGGGLAGTRRWDPSRPAVEAAVLGPPDLRAHRLATCNGPEVAMSDGAGNVFLWAPGGGAAPATALLQGLDCKEFALASDCRTLNCQGETGILKFWDVRSRVLFGTVAGSFRRVVSGALSADGNRLVVGSSDHTVRVWSAGLARAHAGHRGGSTRAAALAWSPDGSLLVSADRGGALQFWNPATGEAAGELQAHEGGARAVAFPAAGRLWASAGHDGVLLWDRDRVQRGRPLAEPTTALAFAPSGQLLAAGGQDGALRLVPLEGGPVDTLPAHGREVRAVAYSPDGARLASSSADGSVLLWDARDRRLLARLEGHESETTALAFSPDGRTLVTGSLDRTLRLWDPADGRALGLLQADFSGECSALAFAPLGKSPASGLLFSASTPFSLHLWDVGNRALLLELSGTFQLAGLAFSPDGRRAAILRADGALRLQQMDGVEQLQSPAKDLAELMRLYKYSAANGDVIRDEEGLRPPAER